MTTTERGHEVYSDSSWSMAVMPGPCINGKSCMRCSASTGDTQVMSLVDTMIPLNFTLSSGESVALAPNLREGANVRSLTGRFRP